MTDKSPKNQGSLNFKAKLVEAEVVDILTSPLSKYEIAEKYSVTPSLISRIRRRKLWKHVSLIIDEAVAEWERVNNSCEN
jgi:hypothetical protein